jgi:hypothetical protein
MKMNEIADVRKLAESVDGSLITPPWTTASATDRTASRKRT